MHPLVNMELVVNEISIKNNNLPVGEFNISPSVTRNIVELDEGHTAVELVAKIVNTEENPFPVDICVSISGIFEITTIPKEELEFFLKIQATQILFPYVRTMISNVTSSALMPAIVLPIIDVRTLFNEE